MNESSTTTEGVSAGSSAVNLDINHIQRLLPHRYPFLLIDRVVELERKHRIVAIKNVSANEPFFQGHFPGVPIMPGVLIVEAMAQSGAVMLFTDLDDRERKLVVFAGIERARFRRPVVPGDQLRLEVVAVAWRRTAGRMQGKAFVDGKLVAEATISCHIVDRPRSENDGAAPPAAPSESE